MIQWSYPSRKEGLYNYSRDDEGNCSVGDMDTQLEYLVIELKSGECKSKYEKFLQITDLNEATMYFCDEIEKAGKTNEDEREKAAMAIYNELIN